MHPLLKYLLPLAVVLPLGGYVAGSLAGVANDDPPARTPIELRDDSATPMQPPRRQDRPTDRPSAPPDREDDGDVPVITPRPVPNDDRDDLGDGDDRDEDDENEDDGDERDEDAGAGDD